MKNSRVLRTAAYAAIVVALSFSFAASGSANSDGVNGASGKNSGFYCRNCHAGGTAPTVAFEGPTTMGLGATAIFRFIVSSHSPTQMSAGLDVAASAGTLGLVAEQGTTLLLSEVTHSSPKTNDVNGQASFEFTWQAPATDGTYTLFGAGCSVNGNSERTGDAAARATYEIVVGVNVPTPTPTSTPSPTATATAAVSACAGDCSGDRQITVDELITGTNIALGLTPPSACLVFDANGDEQVTIDEILQAVNSALNGCPD